MFCLPPTFCLLLLQVPTGHHWTESAPAILETSPIAAVQRLEYAFAPVGSDAVSAPNRAHDLRARIDAAAIEVVPRTSAGEGACAEWRLALATLAIGRGGDLRALGRPLLRANGERVERVHDGLVEWIVNEPRGLEQGWTVTELPPGAPSEPLVLALEVRGLEPRVSADRRSALLVDEDGAVELRYEGLFAWDAEGRELEAQLARTGSGLVIRVDVEGARLPITIDPLLVNADWMYESDQAGARVGTSVSGAGDVNGDGFDDVLVGASLFDGGIADQGRAFLFLGSAAGLSPTPAWTTSGGQVGAALGTSVDSAGDVNGDGFDDVVIGVHEYDAGQAGEGRALVFHGSASGLSLVPDWMTESDQAIAAMGWRVAGAGDVNGDGFDDVLIAAPYIANPLGDEGRAYLFNGSPAGLESTPAWTVEGDQMTCVFGRDLDGAGDVNGDGFDDVIVGANFFDVDLENQGRAFVYLGSPGGLAITPVWTADGVEDFGRFGQAVAGAGDVNGDGYDDVLVGAPLEENELVSEGRAYLFLGSSAGPEGSAAWISEGGEAIGVYASDLAGAGDVNGDGYDDFLVGHPNADGAFSDEGRAHLYLGSPAGPMLSLTCSAFGGQQTALFGLAVNGAGDVNGDGFDDILVGAPLWDGPELEEGAAYLFLGELSDCNGNGIADATDISAGTSADCNANQVPDECDLAAGTSPDADGSGVPDECECTWATYCLTAPNSVDATGAEISANGSASIAANDLVLSAAPCPANQSAVFYFGPSQLQLPFGDGWRCVGGSQVYRLPVVGTGSGTAQFALDLAQDPATVIGPGATWNFQCWYRDPAAGGATFNLSDALEIRFCL